MKEIFKISFGISVAIVGTACLVWWAVPRMFGYSAVFSNPQDAVLLSSGSIIFHGIHVNGEMWIPAQSGSSLLARAPGKNLKGVFALDISQNSNLPSKERYIGGLIYLPMNNKEKISIGRFGLLIDDLSKNDLWYPEEQYTSNLYIEDCIKGGLPYENYEEFPKVQLIELSPTILRQGFKHLTFSGNFKIPPIEIPRNPYMICKDGKMIRNPAPSATISIDEIRINIDSDVDYIWAGKSGKVYRL